MTGNVKIPEAMYDIWAYPVGGQRKNQLLRKSKCAKTKVHLLFVFVWKIFSYTNIMLAAKGEILLNSDK